MVPITTLRVVPIQRYRHLTWQNIVSVARQLDKLEKIIKELSK
ncbi:hypothetical protein ONT16_12195 [Prevotella copri]|uniref:Uncharacterized protein n=1 Tax=Segatella copri TaxID=165179 RepID=A0AAP3F8G1_9BACT|nr:hypothetical protein [Segatella copri]MCW4128993.1 hypothetical protein [Segatella copri]MCW4415254.1 hypothetical protein [Segatella copri]MCW4422256.1 hypothetical protein [Segatella copri]